MTDEPEPTHPIPFWAQEDELSDEDAEIIQQLIRDAGTPSPERCPHCHTLILPAPEAPPIIQRPLTESETWLVLTGQAGNSMCYAFTEAEAKAFAAKVGGRLFTPTGEEIHHTQRRIV